MKILRISLYQFRDNIADIIPYTDNLDVVRILQLLCDDVNGVMNTALETGSNPDMRISVSKFTNTLEYLVSDAVDTVSSRGMEDLKAVSAAALKEIFTELNSNPDWYNYRFEYQTHREPSSGNWLVTLKCTKVYDNSYRACELQSEIASRIMSTYYVSNSSRY